jgi:hypothetical protein
VTIAYFRSPIDDDVDGSANDDQRKFGSHAQPRSVPVPLRFTCRDALQPVGELDLLAHLSKTVDPGSEVIPQTLLVDFYVALKAYPYVILTGPENTGKVAFIEQVAAALGCHDESQYALIPAASLWIGRTGKGGFYRTLNDQFSTWRLIELLQEANAPENSGKLFLVCFNHLRLNELDYYFDALVTTHANGQRQLRVPGFPVEQQPLIPANVLLTATLDLEPFDRLPRNTTLSHGAFVPFEPRTPYASPGVAPLAPVGYQRMLLANKLTSHADAYQKVVRAIGVHGLLQLYPDRSTAQLLHQNRQLLSESLLTHAIWYVAHSFTADGTGLFDRFDRQRNAQLAFNMFFRQSLHCSFDQADQPVLPPYIVNEQARRVA